MTRHEFKHQKIMVVFGRRKGNMVSMHALRHTT